MKIIYSTRSEIPGILSPHSPLNDPQFSRLCFLIMLLRFLADKNIERTCKAIPSWASGGREVSADFMGQHMYSVEEEEAMTQPQKTAKGFAVCKRCDSCGTRISLAIDTDEECILICQCCGKEYRFYSRTVWKSGNGVSGGPVATRNAIPISESVTSEVSDHEQIV